MVICLEQGADCFSYGPADASAIPKPRHLWPRLNPDWFCFSFLCPGKEEVKRVNVVGPSSSSMYVCIYSFVHLSILSFLYVFLIARLCFFSYACSIVYFTFCTIAIPAAFNSIAVGLLRVFSINTLYSIGLQKIIHNARRRNEVCRKL